MFTLMRESFFDYDLSLDTVRKVFHQLIAAGSRAYRGKSLSVSHLTARCDHGVFARFQYVPAT